MPDQTPTAHASHLVLEQIAQQTFPAGTLFVLATPIGNMADISLRALHVLNLVDVVACEDTRNTGQLLLRYGLSKTCIATHQHNEREIADKLVLRLLAGERIALVSDAGTPAISDPGAKLVRAVQDAGLKVVPIAGPCAAVTALSASGLIHERFQFVGFLPSKSAQRENALRELLHVDANLIFYEAPHRIVDMIDALALVFPHDRFLVVGREITKLFEEIVRLPLGSAKAWITEQANHQKGEFVLILGASEVEVDRSDDEAIRLLRILLRECSVKSAASLAADITGMKKNYLYNLALSLKDGGDAS